MEKKETQRSKSKTGEHQPAVGRAPSSEDLAAAANAARDAALAAGTAAERVAVALEHHSGNGNGNGDTKVVDEPAYSGPAYESFMAALQPFIQRAGDRLRVKENAGWVKIEGLPTGERVYVSRAKRAVERVTCTLPPEAIPGASPPPMKNGLIKSHLPPNPEAVGRAILRIAGIKQ